MLLHFQNMNWNFLAMCVGLLFLLINSSSCLKISDDNKKLYENMVSGRGLYYGFPKLTDLDGDKFKPIVFNEQKHKVWLVEFYSHWCGDCQEFVSTWKTFAFNIYEWRDVIGVGTVDCDLDENDQLCRDLGLASFPIIKIFPPNSKVDHYIYRFDSGTVKEMQKTLVKQLRYLIQDEKSKGNHINLKPVSSIELVHVWDDAPSSVKYLALVFEEEDSLVGSEVMLDLSRTKELQVRLVNPSNHSIGELTIEVRVEKGPGNIVVLERNNKTSTLSVNQFTRQEVNEVLRNFLIEKGFDICPVMPSSKNQTVTDDSVLGDIHTLIIEEIQEKLKLKTLSLVAFQVDVELALRHSLKKEISQHKTISGERMSALKTYINILIKYFPFRPQGLDFIRKLKENVLDNKEQVDGETFKEAVMRLEKKFNPFLQKFGWIGCKASRSKGRGYPCGLWTMFHTLTVYEELRDRHVKDERPEVLPAMAAFIKNFFSCADCVSHFTEMAKTIAGNVANQNESIMWLWEAHNKVNDRRAGKEDEDPMYLKIQFPSKEACPTCHLKDGTWNKTEVLTFLKNMYSNLATLTLSDLGIVPSSSTSIFQHRLTLCSVAAYLLLTIYNL